MLFYSHEYYNVPPRACRPKVANKLFVLPLITSTNGSIAAHSGLATIVQKFRVPYTSSNITEKLYVLASLLKRAPQEPCVPSRFAAALFGGTWVGSSSLSWLKQQKRNNSIIVTLSVRSILPTSTVRIYPDPHLAVS